MEVKLRATGYDWHCPNCGKDNYEGKKAFEVACPRCKKKFPVVEVKHKGDPDGERLLVINTAGGAVLTASAYSFDCPECSNEIFVEKPVAVVKCRYCRTQASVTEVTHCHVERAPAARPPTRLAVQPECRQMALF